jgi:predicted  nucleic acid-binding Zn-ribbon protein
MNNTSVIKEYANSFHESKKLKQEISEIKEEKVKLFKKFKELWEDKEELVKIAVNLQQRVAFAEETAENTVEYLKFIASRIEREKMDLEDKKDEAILELQRMSYRVVHNTMQANKSYHLVCAREGCYKTCNFGHCIRRKAGAYVCPDCAGCAASFYCDYECFMLAEQSHLCNVVPPRKTLLKYNNKVSRNERELEKMNI